MAKKAGYQKVVDDYNDVFCKGINNLKAGSDLIAKDYNVMLRINAAVLNMCTESIKKDTCATPKSAGVFTGPNHRVALVSAVSCGAKTVSLKIFSWGDEYTFKDLSEEVLLSHYYGYIACLY